MGNEHIDDILADFKQSFKAAAITPKQEGKPENAEETGDTKQPPGKPVV